MSHDGAQRFFNRELSWLAFNERVLAEATRASYPLLERLNFLSISGSNLDEFFMVRVAGLKGQVRHDVRSVSLDGMSATQQLAAVGARADALLRRQQAVWEELRAALGAAGIAVLGNAEIPDDALPALEDYFRDQVMPVLTPQALDPAHPFPFIPNLGLSLIFSLRRQSDGEPVRELVMIPPTLPRFRALDGAAHSFVAVETLVTRFTAILFPGYDVLEVGAFRIIRDSDIEVEEEAEDLVRYFRSAIKRRRRGRIIRLEIDERVSEALAAEITEGIGATDLVVTETSGFLGISALNQIAAIDIPALKFRPYTPRFPERIREHEGDCFAAIRAKDIVVHHPYESFDVVIAFLNQAAADPDVVAIKQTLYRAGKQPTVIRALCDAAEAGKSVTAVVELKARFDEEQNLLWASQLERAGVQVVYGFIDWKTHAKVSMVVRREGGAFRTYCHFGTGNYHPQTARIYTDLSYFTADPALGRDAAQMFNYITGYVEPHELERLTLSPKSLRSSLEGLIEAEIAHVRAGRPGTIWAKLNALTDPVIIDRLYEASAAGVAIDLIVRGVCCLRPQVPGLSDNIRVKSVIGRFLEHSRVWAFGDGKALPHRKARLFISSADWMPRNFDRRIEYALPIANSTVHDQVLDQVMVANLLDTMQSWELLPDGDYRRFEPASDADRFNLHDYFMTNPSLSGRGGATGAPVPRLKWKRR